MTMKITIIEFFDCDFHVCSVYFDNIFRFGKTKNTFSIEQNDKLLVIFLIEFLSREKWLVFIFPMEMNSAKLLDAWRDH